MARGRFLSDTVAKDQKLNSLSIEAELVYLLTIPHLDRDGLIEADTDLLFGTVCPKRRVLQDRIGEFVEEWIAAGLVLRYDSDGEEVLWFKGFAKNQLGLRYDRETPSRFSPPPSDNCPSTSGKLPEASGKGVAQWQVEVEVEVEVKEEVVAAKESTREEKPKAATTFSDTARLWRKWDANMPGVKTPVVVDSVNALLDEYSVTEFEEAIDIAVKRNNRTLGYIEGILRKGVFKHTNGSAPPRLSEEQKSAISTRAKLARSSLASAQKFKTRVDPQWQKDIDTAKEYGL